MRQNMACLGILVVGYLLLVDITDLGQAQSTPNPGSAAEQGTLPKVTKEIKGSKVPEDKRKSTLRNLEKLEQGIREEEKKTDTKLGEGWLKSLEEPKKKK